MTLAPPLRRAPQSRRTLLERAESSHWAWLAAGALLAFLVPFVFADVLGLPRDLYLAVYAGTVFALFAGWLRTSGLDLAALVSRRWPIAVALAIASGAFLAFAVLREPATARPHGLGLAAAIAWRGVVYGVADGILLGAFPILVVFAALRWSEVPHRLTRTLATGLAALAAVFAFTAVYHAGYADFRSSKLSNPMRGAAFWSAPTLLTLNPVGAPLAHVAMHVTAVVHCSRTDVFLPPH